MINSWFTPSVCAGRGCGGVAKGKAAAFQRSPTKALEPELMVVAHEPAEADSTKVYRLPATMLPEIAANESVLAEKVIAEDVATRFAPGPLPA